MTSDNDKLLLKQIEYYFSDKNLQQDQFFYDLIKQTEKRSIPIETILSCNKIKSFNVNEEDIIRVLHDSTELKISEDNKKIERTKTDLPDFIGKKRVKDNNKDKQIEQPTVDIADIEPLIVYLENNKDMAIKRINLSKKLEELFPDYIILYVRFGYQKGHAAIYHKQSNDNKEETVTLELNEDTFSKVFHVDNIEFKSRLATKDEIKDFWLNHGSHLEFCLGINNKKTKNDKEDKNILSNPVTLGSITYNEIGKIRSKARAIFYSSPANVESYEISSPEDKSFIVDLFKYVKPDITSDIIIKIEKQSAFTYGKSFFLYEKEDSKREVISYLNACLKLGIANRKNK